jgi:hypothetical protein
VLTRAQTCDRLRRRLFQRAVDRTELGVELGAEPVHDWVPIPASVGANIIALMIVVATSDHGLWKKVAAA